MRLGLDIADYAADRSVDRIIFVTGDADCLPVMNASALPAPKSRWCSPCSSDSRENCCGTWTSDGL